MNRSFRVAITAAFLGCFFTTGVQAQSSQIDSELKRLQGHWRITEMVENGHVIPETQMRSLLPGGGLVEIIDYTLLFKSPVNGVKSTKSFRLDPSSYPKQIAILERDKVTGMGIYQFDKGKLVICVANPAAATPSDFTAHENSGRSMMVLESYAPNEGEQMGLILPSPPRATAARPPTQASPPAVEVVEVKTAAPAAAPTIIVNQAPAPTPPPKVIAVASPSVAGRVLTDAEVRTMLIGKWRMNDGEGLVDITFAPNGTFSTFRHAEAINTFHTVFVATPVSSGTWQVSGGQLSLHVNSSYRADRVNTTASFAVRSISNTDAIIVDTLGRVAKVIKLP
ncbi:MAG: TIGR03067 domain-containing protein [Rubripirellula sp.]